MSDRQSQTGETDRQRDARTMNYESNIQTLLQYTLRIYWRLVQISLVNNFTTVHEYALSPPPPTPETHPPLPPLETLFSLACSRNLKCTRKIS